MSALDVLLVAAVLVGVSVQSAIGFGFAFFVAPAALAALPAEQAVTLVATLGIAINSLVLFAERRPTEVAARAVTRLTIFGAPGLLIGAWALTEVDQALLQGLVGVIVLTGAAAQWASRRAPVKPTEDSDRGSSVSEAGAGLLAGALSTSVSVNGPPLVLALTHRGLRGSRLRDTLAATLLSFSLLSTLVLLAVVGDDRALPHGWAPLAAIPALALGHRFGAAAFRRLDDGSHHRATLIAVAIAGLLSIGAALI